MTEHVCELDATAKASADAVTRLLGLDVASVCLIAGGGNNKLYRVDTLVGETLVAKNYFRQPSDSRDRLYAEFEGLDFLWRNGIRRIARPRACDRKKGIGIYDYVAGEAAGSVAATNGDIRQAVQFLGRLKKLTELSGAEALPEASEAGFSLGALLQILRRRLERLRKVAPVSALQKEFCTFRDKQIVWAFERIAETAQSRRAVQGYSPEARLETGRRNLSSSDFGFHNAVRRPDGELILVDFEYFGWDDPDKTISDFLLHPAMALEPARGEAFVAASLDLFCDDDLANRLQAYFPLFGLKWTMIVLNEFLPGGWTQRLFSGADAENEEAHLQGQLKKAAVFLDGAIRANAEFPYGA